MRALTGRSLVLLLVVLLAVGGYTLYWDIAATRLAHGLRLWALNQRPQGIDASWQKLAVGGYPFSFRITVAGARITEDKLTPQPQLELPSLSGSAWPWNLREWRLSAPGGLVVGLFADGAPKLSAKRAGGALSLFREGGAKVALQLEKVRAETLTAERAALGLTVPPQAPHKDTEDAFSLSVRLQGMQLPFALAPLGSRIADLVVALSVKGRLEAGPLERAAAAWRDAGGTIVLRQLRLHWGPLDANASGTLALDRQLQPMGAFSGTIEGYDQVVDMLVASGRLRREAGKLAHVALRMLSQRAPDGKREITTSLTIQNGEIYLGPAKLGPVPRLSWR